MAGIDLNIDFNALGGGIVADEKALQEISDVIDTKEDILETEEVKDKEEKEEKEEVEDKNIESEESDDKGESSEEKDNNTNVEQEYESPITLFAATLQDAGVFNNIDLKELDSLNDEDKIQTLISVRNEEIENRVEEGVNYFINSLPEKVKKIVEAYKDDLPIDEIIKTQSEIQKWESVKVEDIEENETIQQNIHKAYYKEMTKFTDKEIDKKVRQDMEDEDNLELSVNRLDALKKISKDKQVEIETKEKERKEVEKLKIVETNNKVKEYVNQKKEILAGIPISNKEKQDLTDSLLNTRIVDGKPMNDVIELRNKDIIGFETKLRYYVMKGLFDENPKFDFVEKKAQSTIAKKLINKLQSTDNKVTGVPNRPIKSNMKVDDTIDLIRI